MQLIYINLAELISAIEGQNIGRLSACWLVAAHQKITGGEERKAHWGSLCKEAGDFGVRTGDLEAVEEHCFALPLVARGNVTIR